MNSDTNSSVDPENEPDAENSTIDPDASSTAQQHSDTGVEEELPYQAHPTLRPTLIWLGIVLILGVGSILYVMDNPSVFGGSDVATLIVRALLLVTIIGVVRFLVRLYVLRRTEYTIDEQSVTRRYELLFRSWQREVPLAMVRSHEARQSRIQKLLGYGTVALNQGLGVIELENIPNPHHVHDMISRLIE